MEEGFFRLSELHKVDFLTNFVKQFCAGIVIKSGQLKQLKFCKGKILQDN